MIEAEVYISLKKTVADPQGLTIKHALESLGHEEVEEVRIGKLIKLKMNVADKKEAEAKLESMCKKLLANPVIEEYIFKVKD